VPLSNVSALNDCYMVKRIRREEPLSYRIARLEKENEVLLREIEFLLAHPSMVEGLKGERLIAELTGGELTQYAEEHDVTISGRVQLEVKMSRAHHPNKKARTMRWAWSKPRGGQRRKRYDYLVLVGEKVPGSTDEYKQDDEPYVFFLIPTAKVPQLCSDTARAEHETITLTTTPSSVRSAKGKLLNSYIVKGKEMSAVFRKAIAAPTAQQRATGRTH